MNGYGIKITYELDTLGMSKKIRGYNFCRSAVEELLKRDSFCRMDTVYGKVAKKFNTNILCVERNIRYAVEKTWEKGNIDTIEEKFGFTVSMEKGKPTNSEFIYMIADRVKHCS